MAATQGAGPSHCFGSLAEHKTNFSLLTRCRSSGREDRPALPARKFASVGREPRRGGSWSRTAPASLRGAERRSNLGRAGLASPRLLRHGSRPPVAMTLWEVRYKKL